MSIAIVRDIVALWLKKWLLHNTGQHTKVILLLLDTGLTTPQDLIQVAFLLYLEGDTNYISIHLDQVAIVQHLKNYITMVIGGVVLWTIILPKN